MNLNQQEKCQQALARAQNPRSILNMATVMQVALAAGITDAIPGENVLTFNAWKAKGRSVAKGQKALCKLSVFYTKDVTDAAGELHTEKRPGTSAVFHISQTVEMEPTARYSGKLDGMGNRLDGLAPQVQS